jgi:hypothetical protein
VKAPDSISSKEIRESFGRIFTPEMVGTVFAVHSVQQLMYDFAKAKDPEAFNRLITDWDAWKRTARTAGGTPRGTHWKRVYVNRHLEGLMPVVEVVILTNRASSDPDETRVYDAWMEYKVPHPAGHLITLGKQHVDGPAAFGPRWVAR